MNKRPPLVERASGAVGSPDHVGETAPLSPADRELVGKVTAAPSVALAVYHRDGAEVIPLEPAEAVVVGRGLPADVVVRDRSLSRQHARFVLEDGALSVEDLGSTNGTRVQGQLVERAVVRPGEPVYLGSVIVSAYVRSPTEPALGTLASHDWFLQLLEREVVQAKHFGDAASVLMVKATSDSDPDAHVSAWFQRVRAELRPVDEVALYSADTIEVLLPRLSAAEACRLGEKIVQRVAWRGTFAGCGVAGYPSSAAASAEALVDVCRQALETATPATPVRLASSTDERVALVPPDPSDGSSSKPVVVSPAMKELFRAVARVASSSIPVLLLGETGSGKEVVARAIHQAGPRQQESLVCVNCGAIPAQLVESTLFGHVRGAFTGADRFSEGVFGAADGGSVLLDEIGELPPAAQAALLRVLESGRVARVGAAQELAVDVRVVAATHCDLEGMCDSGAFRRDLLYRINAVTLRIPPLRERVEEIRPLAQRFLEQTAAEVKRGMQGIEERAMAALERYRWPGNVRELCNVIARGVVIARSSWVELDDLPERVRAHATASVSVPPEGEAAGGDDEDLDLKSRVRRHETRLIIEALRATGGNQTHAALRLKVPLRTLVHKLKTLGISKSDYS